MGKKKVLLIRLSALGDVIFNLPLASILKSNGYEVFWLTSEKGFDIVNNNPIVDEAILAPVEKWKKQNVFQNFIEYIKILQYLRSKHFDIAIDTQLLLKSAIWTAFCGAKRRIVSSSAREFAQLAGNENIGKLSYDYTTHAARRYLKFAEYLGLETNNIEVSLPAPSEKTINRIDALTKDLDKTKPIIGIAPATTWVTKHWNRDNWKELIQKLEKDYTIVFTGTGKDIDLIDYISEGRHPNFAGKTNLPELIELFRRCNAIISLDSGSTHLAWASQHPKIVSIFCSTPAGFYAPLGTEEKYIALSGNHSCQPCHKKHCPNNNDQNKCTLLPTVDEVSNAVYKLLQQQKENK